MNITAQRSYWKCSFKLSINPDHRLEQSWIIQTIKVIFAGPEMSDGTTFSKNVSKVPPQVLICFFKKPSSSLK